MKRTRAVTQMDVARAAHVSQGVVSAVLSSSNSGTLSVSRETRMRVLAEAERQGYIIRRSKPSQAKVRKQPGVLFIRDMPTPEPGEAWVSSGYTALFGKIVSELGIRLKARGMGISIHYYHESHDLMQWLAESDPCGVIWHAGVEKNDSSLLHWVASRYPMVMFNCVWRNLAAADSVSVDQEMNVSLAADHLWQQGHHRIAIFGHGGGRPIFDRRVDEYRKFVRERGLRDYTEFRDIPDEQERPAAGKVSQIFETWRRLGADAPTALITGDVFALRVLDMAPNYGIHIPGDLSVVGIDNTEPCAFIDPPLTSVEEPFGEMCGTALDLLVRRMHNRQAPSQCIQIAPRLIIRESVKPVPVKPQQGKEDIPD